MKRNLQWLALAALCTAMTSCGLPGAVARTAGNTVNTAMSAVGRVANGAMAGGGM